MSQEFHFDIDKIANSAAVPTDKTTELIQQTTEGEADSLSFFDKLTDEQKQAISSRVPSLVDTFVENQNSLLDFGKEAVDDVNKTVNHILKEQKNIQIPQVDEMLLNTNRELNGFVAKYKNVAEAAELEKKPNLLQKLFKQSKNTIQDFYFEAQSIENRMDSLAASVAKNEDTLSRNIVSAELLIEENTNSIENLVGVIAFVEASGREASQRAHKLQNELALLDPTSVDYQVKNEEMMRITEVVNSLEQQRTEYISRLYVAWATTPQMRNLVKVSSDMKQKLGMIRRNTIPTMKLSIAQLGMLQQSVKAEVTADAIINANNAALQMLAETSKEAIPRMEATAQRPTLAVETVTKLAESLVAQNEGIIQAINNGRAQRQQLEATIVKSAQTINDSVMLRDRKIVEALLEEGKATQENLAKSSPEDVTPDIAQ
ncbi:toxic anion resistance protein [Streptococcus merionis]|uniref:Toxic anion resistance protein n=1 Tax=Streptococcus merionis TaxID=400065 RepID=A0A239SN56_9STRE|nr:toxic anion resistance protein [Streptococcus merionis]SNU86308.1 toxic anion resistance protein [Streptococcus merionis]